MRTSELVACLPKVMKAHPLVAWEVTSHEQDDDLVVSLRLTADPERAAEVRVDGGGEVFLLRFAGHESADFAYDGDADQIETLTRRLELANLALIGPTRVVVSVAGGQVVRSDMVIDPDAEHPRRETVATWPLRRFRARLLFRRVTDQVVYFERVTPP